jgi:formate hydrogenlyase subunit 3/multisubunit Na+/H+ antiporter MnhD subunit
MVGWLLFTGNLAPYSLLIGVLFSLIIAFLTYSLFIHEHEADKRALLPRVYLLGIYLLLIIFKMYAASFQVSQMGYILAGFGAGHVQGLTAPFLHVINHGIFKSLLFLSVGCAIHVAGERDLKRLGNLAQKLPLVMIMFLVGALSISGIPPFKGFISKKLLFASSVWWWGYSGAL